MWYLVVYLVLHLLWYLVYPVWLPNMVPGIYGTGYRTWFSTWCGTWYDNLLRYYTWRDNSVMLPINSMVWYCNTRFHFGGGVTQG